MRHQKAGKKLNRTASHRNAMFRNMVTSLFEHGQIRTTDVKAKELKRWADRVITLAKRGDLHARRQALAIMMKKNVVHKLFEEVSSRFGDRAGGYTSVIRIGRRRGDAAPMSLVELVAPIEKQDKKKKPKAAGKKVEEPKKQTLVKAGGKEEPEVQEEEAIQAEQQESTAPEDESPAEKAEADTKDKEVGEVEEVKV